MATETDLFPICRVLLVADDITTVCGRVQALGAGFAVTAVRDAEAALQMALGLHDVVLIEQTETLEALRVRRLLADQQPGLPVVFLSADPRIDAAAKTAGVFGYLVRPFTDDQLRWVTQHAAAECRPGFSQPLEAPAFAQNLDASDTAPLTSDVKPPRRARQYRGAA